MFKYLGGCFLGFVESDKLVKGGERGTQTDITAGKISSVIKWGSRKAVSFWATESAVLFHIFLTALYAAALSNSTMQTREGPEAALKTNKQTIKINELRHMLLDNTSGSDCHQVRL